MHTVHAPPDTLLVRIAQLAPLVRGAPRHLVELGALHTHARPARSARCGPQIRVIEQLDSKLDALGLEIHDKRLPLERLCRLIVVHLDTRLAFVVFEQHAVARKDVSNLMHARVEWQSTHKDGRIRP